MTVLNCELYRNQYFVIEQCRNCSVPGYLIISPVKKALCLTELDEQALGMLGPTLALALTAVREVIKPLKIYCVQFGEEKGQFHFHVFPRTKEITEEYLKGRPKEEKLIHGPILFNWARERYKNVQDSQELNDAIERIRWRLNYPE
jgi:diadenosine tetraphosphate (Ap4A) HIT family hydrolase